MRITKGQLRRIIAEEHALVYGKKTKPTNKKVSRKRTTAKPTRRKLSPLKEARRRDLMIEARAEILVEELLEEGFFSKLMAGLKGAGSHVGEKMATPIKKAAQLASSAWEETQTAYRKAAEEQEDKEKAAALEAATEAAESEAIEHFKKYLKDLVATLLKGGYEDDDAQAEASTMALAAWPSAPST